MPCIDAPQTHYIGRFAPSPTGLLHFGSLITATASYLEARTRQGKWLLRIEDIDPPREMPGATTQIPATLEAFGFQWDDTITWQSQRQHHYAAALQTLSQQNLTYPCHCTRKQLAEAGHIGPYGLIYPGTCRQHLTTTADKTAIRLITHNQPIHFTDQLQGEYTQTLQTEIGDFQLLRKEGYYTYHLAVVVDDALQNITHIVRGSDLLDSTPRQIYLQTLLGYPTPAYLHLPIALNPEGQKLSKQNLATPINPRQANTWLWHALQFLGQNPPAELQPENLHTHWQWALAHWNTQHIPAQTSAPLPAELQHLP